MENSYKYFQAQLGLASWALARAFSLTSFGYKGSYSVFKVTLCPSYPMVPPAVSPWLPRLKLVWVLPLLFLLLLTSCSVLTGLVHLDLCFAPAGCFFVNATFVWIVCETYGITEFTVHLVFCSACSACGRVDATCVLNIFLIETQKADVPTYFLF